jgi:hypothetical protein
MNNLFQIIQTRSCNKMLLAVLVTVSFATMAFSQTPLQWARQFSGNLPSNTSIAWDVELDDTDNSYVVGNSSHLGNKIDFLS